VQQPHCSLLAMTFGSRLARSALGRLACCYGPSLLEVELFAEASVRRPPAVP
jgi:hypothetical protein